MKLALGLRLKIFGDEHIPLTGLWRWAPALLENHTGSSSTHADARKGNQIQVTGMGYTRAPALIQDTANALTVDI
jgi:hypothetical protein